MYEENHVLTQEEIIQYQKSGYSLSKDRLYIIKFLFNDKQNEAVDPRPFRIKTSLIKKLATDSIDMPYVVNPNDTSKHLRGTHEGRPDTAKDLLEIQAKYSIGLIKIPLITATNNVYGIIEVWKEFEKMVLNGELPKSTSPTLFVIKEDENGIEDAQFLNINGVDKGGYPDILSGTHGICKGGIKQCMEELAPIAAAGKLIESRTSPLFLNSLPSLKSIMSQQTQMPSIENVVKDVEALKSEVMNIKTMLEQIMTKVGGDAQQDQIPVGSAGNDKNVQKLVMPKELKDNEFVKAVLNEKKTTEQKLADLERKIKEDNEKKQLEIRKAQAVSIVEKMILFKQIKAEDKNAKIEEYMKLADETGKLKDLDILDNYLKSTIQSDSDSPIGAGGSDNSIFFHEDHSDSEITNSQAMGYDF